MRSVITIVVMLTSLGAAGQLTVSTTALHFGGQTVGTSTFTKTFPSGSNYVSGLGVGDVNGDGKLDLVVANGLANSITVLRGNGDGTFQLPVGYAVGNWPNGHVIVADFNRDGKPDIAVANQNSGTVSVLLNNGDGTFGPAATYTGFPTAFDLVAADFNRDGIVDLAVAAQTSTPVLLGNGDGTFTPGAAMVSSTYQGITAADFNHDGNVDLATPNAVYLGNGDGTFGAAIPMNSFLEFVESGDFNGDGRQDLAGVVRSGSPGSDAVQLALGNGDGTMENVTSYSASAYQWLITVSDLNGDHLSDMVTTSDVFPFVSVLLGQANGSLSSTTNYGWFPINASPAAVGDFDRDGHLDIATSVAGQVAIMLGRGDGSFSAPQGVVLANNSNTDLSITGATITGPNATDFKVYASSCGGHVVGPSWTTACAVAVQYSPSLLGSEAAVLTITDSAGERFDVALDGDGLPPADSDSGLALLAGPNTFDGNQTVVGTVAATNFVGNGSGLTGVGTITGVMAGAGLSGGGTGGSVTLTNTGLLSLAAGTGLLSSGGQAPTIGLDLNFTDERYLQLSGGSVSGNLAAASFSGSGFGLTNLNPANLTPGTAAINITGSAASAMNAANATTANVATNATNLGGVPAADFARVDTGNTFNGNQSINGGVNINGWGLTVKSGVSTGGVYANAAGTATASQAYNSTPLALIASTFNSSSGQFVSQGFQWVAEPTGSNTANPSATLSLQSSSWTIPSPGLPMNDTGLSINSQGRLAAPAVAIGGGTTITDHVSFVASVAFNSKMSPGSCLVWTSPMAAAADGDSVVGALSNSLMSSTIVFSAWANSGSVSVRICNPTGSPTTIGSGTIRVDLWKH